MRRLIVVFMGLLLVSPARGEQPTTEEKQTTIAWLRSMQQPNGGFSGDHGKEPNVRTTALALRALKRLGGEVPNLKACEQYMLSERDPSGGFRQPIGHQRYTKAMFTAVGVMGLVELNKDPETFAADIDYMLDYSRMWDEVRMTAAALESVYGGAIKFPQFEPWIAEIRRQQNADGTWGVGGGRAAETAAAVVTILRFGGQIDKKEQVVQALKTGQRADGGWGPANSETSDLSNTYLVMRALVMLKAKPDVAACEAFVSKCRNENGSYKLQLAGAAPTGPGPGRGGGPPADPPEPVVSTYYAVSIFHWLETMK